MTIVEEDLVVCLSAEVVVARLLRGVETLIFTALLGLNGMFEILETLGGDLKTCGSELVGDVTTCDDTTTVSASFDDVTTGFDDIDFEIGVDVILVKYGGNSVSLDSEGFSILLIPTLVGLFKCGSVCFETNISGRSGVGAI